MPRVFLSRDLRADSPFHGLRHRPGWRLEARSLLRFTMVAVAEAPAAPWLFFYSARGVRALLEQHRPRPDQRLACLGPAAARALAEHGLVADFTGDGVPARVARALHERVGPRAVTFLQARRSRASVQRLLPNDVPTSAVIVYDNQPLEDFTLAPADYLIFTSPLNFSAYRRRYPPRPEQRLIAIGATTADNFSEPVPVKGYRIASAPNEPALLSCLLEWEREDPINHISF